MYISRSCGAYCVHSAPCSAPERFHPSSRRLSLSWATLLSEQVLRAHCWLINCQTVWFQALVSSFSLQA